jgi:hypothetical protein
LDKTGDYIYRSIVKEVIDLILMLCSDCMKKKSGSEYLIVFELDNRKALSLFDVTSEEEATKVVKEMMARSEISVVGRF